MLAECNHIACVCDVSHLHASVQSCIMKVVVTSGLYFKVPSSEMTPRRDCASKLGASSYETAACDGNVVTPLSYNYTVNLKRTPGVITTQQQVGRHTLTVLSFNSCILNSSPTSDVTALTIL